MSGTLICPLSPSLSIHLCDLQNKWAELWPCLAGGLTCRIVALICCLQPTNEFTTVWSFSLARSRGRLALVSINTHTEQLYCYDFVSITVHDTKMTIFCATWTVWALILRRHNKLSRWPTVTPSQDVLIVTSAILFLAECFLFPKSFGGINLGAYSICCGFSPSQFCVTLKFQYNRNWDCTFDTWTNPQESSR